MKKGFTLIELLIVVAIIAILAAIAVPNFLEAQTRAKVSRAKSDIRAVATAVEAYAIDNNVPPIDGSAPNDGQAYWYPPGGPTGPEGRAGGLTSPVAYITSVKMIDPFRTAVNASTAYGLDAPDSRYFEVSDYTRFRYTNFQYTYTGGWRNPPLPTYYAQYAAVYGTWRLMSSGPDKVAGPTVSVGGSNPAITQYTPYDPTNGTMSLGEIVRSQKYPEQVLLPI
jgi:prepilin-type N-terminal cleavage/methylation domain-containing protein